MLISLLIAVLVFALLWYLVGMLPIDPKFKQIAQIILIIIAIIYLLQLLLPLAGISTGKLL